MSAITTARPINLAQLAAELADPPAALSMTDDGTERTITAHDDTTTAEALQAAVDAHEPAPTVTTEAWLRQQINDLTDLILFS